MMYIHALCYFFFSCSSSSSKEDSDTSTEVQIPFVQLDSPTKLVLIPERPQDFSIAEDGAFFISSQTGDYLYHLQKDWNEIQEMYAQQSIDPQDIREETTGNFNNILALEHIGNDLYFTTTDFGVEGSLSWISSFNGISYQTEELYTTSTDGTLIRHPVELQKNIANSDSFPEDLWIADYEARALFSYSNDQISVYSAGQEHPESLTFGYIGDTTVLFIGGEEGIWYKESPDGLPKQYVDIPALSMTYIPEKKELWIGNSDGIFVIQTSEAEILPLHISNISSRISRLDSRNDFLLYTDGVGEYVYMTKIIRNE